MDSITAFFSTVYNVPELIRLVGFYGLIAIVFAETGLLVGFFLPGDSLLITAGLFAARGDLSIHALIPTLIVAAIVGNATGYWIGARTGAALYSRPDSLLFRREHVRMTHEYYERHGGKTVVLAQFIPILRTFAPVVAGVGQMGYRQFATFNVLGAILWVSSMTLAGYLLGNLVPNIEKRIHIVVAIVILVSLIPVVPLFYVSPALEGSRYLYLASVGWAAILVAAAHEVHKALYVGRIVVPLIAFTLVAAYGTRVHLRPWSSAAALRDRVLAAAAADKTLHACEVVFVQDLPTSVQGAYVFLNGAREALAGVGLDVHARNSTGPCSFKWDGATARFEPAALIARAP